MIMIVKTPGGQQCGFKHVVNLPKSYRLGEYGFFTRWWGGGARKVGCDILPLHVGRASPAESPDRERDREVYYKTTTKRGKR